MTKVQKKNCDWKYEAFLNSIFSWSEILFFNSSSEEIKTAFSIYINYNVITNGIFSLWKGFLKNFKPFCMAWTCYAPE